MFQSQCLPAAAEFVFALLTSPMCSIHGLKRLQWDKGGGGRGPPGSYRTGDPEKQEAKRPNLEMQQMA